MSKTNHREQAKTAECPIIEDFTAEALRRMGCSDGVPEYIAPERPFCERPTVTINVIG